MKKGNVLIIASTIIWGAVIIGCALKLKGTSFSKEINLILFFGMLAHLLFVWAPLKQLYKKEKKFNRWSNHC
ncbi:MAG: hypothetical protein R6V16_06245 [Bacteroidales bacterium]